MNLFAVFETWHLADGNYPPLSKGQCVNLSFEIEPDDLIADDATAAQRFYHRGQAEYDFRGVVLRVYGSDGDSERIIVVEAEGFRFYINSPLTAGLRVGHAASGRGTLALDHYLWVEFLSQYNDPPNLFYNLRVEDICRIRIPERFITRSGLNISYPTRLPPDQCGPDDLAHVDTITDEEYCTFVIQFSDNNLVAKGIPRTFH